MSNTNISVRMNESDMELLKEYSKLTDKSISVIVREAVIDKIEEDMDVNLFLFAKENTKKFYSHEEILKELGIEKNE